VNIAGVSELLEMRTPWLSANRDRYSNRLDAAKERVLVVAKNDSPAARTAAQKVENFFYRLFHDFARRRTAAVYAPDRRAIGYQVSRGCGIRHLDWAPDLRSKLLGAGAKTIKELRIAVAKAVKDGFDGNPFVLHAPDPLSVYWDKDFSTVCQVGPVQVSALLAYYDDLRFGPGGFSRALKGEDITSDVMGEAAENIWGATVIQYHLETKQYIYDVLQYVHENEQENFMVEVLPNPAGRPRYTFCAGQLTEEEEPHLQFKPLIGDLYPPAQLVNITGTLIQSGALSGGRPMYQLVDAGGNADDWASILQRPVNERPVIEYGPTSQTLTNPPTGKEWKPVPVPDQTQVIAAHQQNMLDMKELGFPLPIASQGGGSASSGYQEAIQRQGSVDFLEPPLANLASAWRELFLIAADTLKNAKIPVTILTVRRAEGEDPSVQQKITVIPDDFADFDLEVRMESITETGTFARRESDQRLLDAEPSLISRRKVMEREHDDPEREEQRIADEGMAEKMNALAEQLALRDIAARIPQLKEQVAVEEGVPQAAQPQGDSRPQRPPGGASSQGLGRPNVQPVQVQPGQVAEPTLAGEGVAQ
jgi:hypothetical protein